MQIVNHKPAARGVSQLMYVGDDYPEEQVPASLSLGKVGVVAGVVILLMMFGGRKR